MPKSINLSIRLLKDNVVPAESLKEININLEEYEKIEGALFYRYSLPPYSPDWANYLGKNNVKVSSASALLFISNSNRWFVLCFGYAHLLLEQNKLVDDFGLRTVLNMLDKGKIKSSDIFVPSDHSKQRRTQTTRESSLRGHDLDGHINILKNITGKTKYEYKDMATNISATSDSIKFSTQKPIEDIPNVCKDLLDIYQKDDYETEFPEVLHIKPVKNESELTLLKGKLLNALGNVNESIYLEVPELIDFQDIHKYQFNLKNRKRNKEKFDFMPSIEEFLNLLDEDKKQSICQQDLEKWELELLDANSNLKRNFSLFKCLVYEAKLNDRQYHFSHGKWYSIDPDFSKELDDNLQAAKIETINSKQILEFNHPNEEEYNQDLAENIGGVLLDKNCIPMGGYDKIEPCDVFCVSSGNENIFIHVKIKHSGSSGLSHLFEQGDVALTLLNSKEENFLTGVKDRIPSFEETKDKIVHYLIVSKNDSIPLFAKIVLSKKIDQIKAKGANVQWSIVKNQYNNNQ